MGLTTLLDISALNLSGLCTQKIKKWGIARCVRDLLLSV